MKGRTLIYRSSQREPEITEWAVDPGLRFLQNAVGGYIEAVPHLRSVEIDGVVVPCVAYCHEEGKLKNQPYNPSATRLWHYACQRITDADGKQLFPNGLMRGERPADILVGDIIIVTGDAEFLRRHCEGPEDEAQ